VQLEVLLFVNMSLFPQLMELFMEALVPSNAEPSYVCCERHLDSIVRASMYFPYILLWGWLGRYQNIRSSIYSKGSGDKNPQRINLCPLYCRLQTTTSTILLTEYPARPKHMPLLEEESVSLPKSRL